MKCYQVDGKGIDTLKLVDCPAPKILHDEDVLIDVKACSLNYRDLMVAKGQYNYKSEDFPLIPLSDMSGVVREVGSKVSDLKPGDRVLNSSFRHWPAGTLRSNWARTFVGGNGVNGILAEQIVYPSEALVKLPAHLNFAEGATFTIAGLTAWAAIVTHGKTRPGDWVLLQGTGGVSIFAAQLARSLGAKTIMTTSSAEKAEFVKKNYGVTATVNYHDADWGNQVKEITQGNGVNVVVNVAGGKSLNESVKICTYGARVATIGNLSQQESTLDIRLLLTHQVHVIGIYMESMEELRAFMKAVEATKLKPVVDRTFSFQEVREAYQYLESQKHIGKVVITL